jgi:hypothetical protein
MGTEILSEAKDDKTDVGRYCSSLRPLGTEILRFAQDDKTDVGRYCSLLRPHPGRYIGNGRNELRPYTSPASDAPQVLRGV